MSQLHSKAQRRNMPSFVNNGNAPIDVSNAGVVHLNNLHYEDESTFVKGTFARKTLPTATIDRCVSNDSSFDDNSSDSSGLRTPVTGLDGDYSHPSPVPNNATATMKSLPNGRSSQISLNSMDGINNLDSGGNGYIQNLKPATDRSFAAPTGAANGPVVNGVSPFLSKQTPHFPAIMSDLQDERSPVPSSARTSLQQTPVDFHAPAMADSQTVAPQRYSSPAQYGGSSSTPTLQAAPPNSLRQRHTLEVPRQQQNNRGSIGKDAPADTALATGRFSPVPRRPSFGLGRRNTRSINSEIQRDGVLPDEDAARWTEAYRQKRARRKRRDDEDDDKVLVGTKVDETHANWETAYNMLTGIRVSVSRTNAKLDRPLTDADFEAKQKSTFDMCVSILPFLYCDPFYSMVM